MSQTVLITGATGFAGRYLVDLCKAHGDKVVCTGGEVDLVDSDAALRLFADASPEVVYHLAARAHVGESWEDPSGTLRDNVAMTQNVLDGVRRHSPDATVVVVTSGEVYGPPEALPVTERAQLRPQNPYALSKAACDLLAGFYADAHGLNVIRARSFNHIGPGQQPMYAAASFAKQVAEGLEGGASCTVTTGNPDTRRDYTDVRDVVRAYRALAASAQPGAYNVCSGVTASAREIIKLLGEAAQVEIEHVVDAARQRKHEVQEICGSNLKLHEATGWSPAISLEKTVMSTLSWWRDSLVSSRVSDDSV